MFSNLTQMESATQSNNTFVMHQFASGCRHSRFDTPRNGAGRLSRNGCVRFTNASILGRIKRLEFRKEKHTARRGHRSCRRGETSHFFAKVRVVVILFARSLNATPSQRAMNNCSHSSHAFSNLTISAEFGNRGKPFVASQEKKRWKIPCLSL